MKCARITARSSVTLLLATAVSTTSACKKDGAKEPPGPSRAQDASSGNLSRSARSSPSDGKELVVGEIWASDETGAALRVTVRTIEKSDLERIVFEAFRAQGGRQRATAPGRLQVRVAVAKREKHESLIAVNGVLSIDDDRLEANAIGFRPIPKGEGADKTYREIVERAVRDTVQSLVSKLRVPKLSTPDLVALITSRPDGGAESEKRLIAVGELAERRVAAEFDLFISLLKDDDPHVARRAVGALVSLKDARAVNPLIDFAARKDPQTLREVIYALGDLGGAKAEAFLWTLEKGHEHPAIRQAAREAIDLIKKRR